MRDLNYQLKQLCHRNRDGSYATQAKRMNHLMLIADQLYDLGYRGMKLRSVKQKQVDALVKDWLRPGLAVGTIKNRMAVLRWWAEKVDRRNVVARSNAYYGIPDRQFVTKCIQGKGGRYRGDELAKRPDRECEAVIQLWLILGSAEGPRWDPSRKYRIFL